jgi:hypothetical protein
MKRYGSLLNHLIHMCEVELKISRMFYKVITCWFALIYFTDSQLMNKLNLFNQVVTLLNDEQEFKLGDVHECKKLRVLHHLNA